MAHDEPDWKLQFASDNTAPVCPEAWEALQRANDSPRFTLGYGEDPVTARAEELVREVFDAECDVFFVFNGSAANSVALSAMCQPFDGILCHPFSHADSDEANAPEFFTRGAKLIQIQGEAGKLDPSNVPAALERGHGIHSARIRAVSITEATEVGTVYSPEEIARITAIREWEGCGEFRFHMDGARLANALAALGDAVCPKDLTWKAGIDVLSFGGAKNGLPATEALVFFDRSLARDFAWRRKQAGQLSSKMRYLAAPWIGILQDGAWLRHAAHANACAGRLAQGLASLPGVTLAYPVESNGVFVRFPDGVAERLHRRGWHFYSFSVANAWRFMCNWATTFEAVDALLADARSAVAG